VEEANSSERHKSIATFAAAIVQARGVTDVASLQDAWTDAKFIIYPDPADDAYRAWQLRYTARAPQGLRQVR
jgi:hypothetical protein